MRLDSASLGRLASSAPRWVTGLLVILIGAQLAFLVTSPAPQVPQAAPIAPATSRNVVDVPSILRANLFGAPAASPDGSNAPVTSLALVLAGVVAASDPSKGYALLGPSANATKLYAVGTALPGGARLHSVYPDRVLLDRSGTVEALPLPKRSAVSAPPPPPPPAAAEQALERVQQLVRDRPGIIGEIMRPQAVISEGRQRGYRVYPGPNQQAFNRLGLRPGDLVTAINGTTLDDPNRGGEIFGTLASVAEARVSIVRNGAPQELVLNLADVANEAERLGPSAEQAPATDAGMGQPSPAATR